MGQTNSTYHQTILQGELDVTLCSELASALFSWFSKDGEGAKGAYCFWKLPSVLAL